MENVFEILEKSFLTIELKHWAYFILGLLVTLIVQKIIIGILGRKVIKIAKKTSTKLDELFLNALLRPLSFVLFIMGFYISLNFLKLPEDSTINLDEIGNSILIIALTFSLTWFLLKGADIIKYYLEKATAKTDTKLDDQLVPIIVKALKIAIITLAVLVILQNFGYSITSILASLGIGGVALALASKDTVENLFGSIVVFSDKPFQLEDWVKVGDVEGTVEEVGLRSTKIRRFDKALVTLPNSKLTNTAIVNFNRREMRRIKMNVLIGYSSSVDQIKKSIDGIKNIIASDDRFYQGFYLVNFNELADSGLNIFIYAFTNTAVWADYLKIKEDFMIKILELLEELKVEIAYPSQTLYVRQEKWDT
jgi:MscS family membrane protein